MKVKTETRPEVHTDEDEVVHAFQSRTAFIETGTPSVCGLVLFLKEPVLGDETVPANPCSLCLERLGGGL